MRAFRPALVALALLATAPAWAQEVIPPEAAAASSLSLSVFLSTLVYGAIGILFTLLGYFIFDKVAGLNLRHELVEDQNVAVGIMLAGVFIGLSIVVAAVMLS